jgi:hypothetical protein
VNVDQEITSVARVITNLKDFRSQARSAAAALGPSVIPTLSEKFHSPPEAPAGFGCNEVGLGGWLAIWQAAIFEVLFQFRQDALPLLRQVAFGEYDWTQSYALATLCRLAADGVEPETVLSDIKRELPAMRYEAWLGLASLLLGSAKNDPGLAEIVTELESVPEFHDALKETQAN